MTEQEKRSNAGRKAWQTRRERERSKARSEAARKAWMTRKEKKKAATRSEAGRKAWRTRLQRAGVEGVAGPVPKAEPVRVSLPHNKRSDAAFKAWETRRQNGWVHPNKRPD